MRTTRPPRWRVPSPLSSSMMPWPIRRNADTKSVASLSGMGFASLKHASGEGRLAIGL